jgi:DNA invertase Pin-like site-specific DNA recombinase
MSTEVETVKAVSYLRVSGKGQVNGDGFPRQREAIATYAAQNRLEVVTEYRDEGVSGTKELDDRDGLSALLARVCSNGVRVVLIERADRLARDLVVSELILNQFRDCEVRVIAVDSGTDLTVGDDDPTRTLIRQVLGAVAQFEKAVIVMKLRAARNRKRRDTGRCEGIKPFGTKLGEAEVVAYIHELRSSGSTLTEIATRLTAEGKPTRTGRPWCIETVSQICKRLLV